MTDFAPFLNARAHMAIVVWGQSFHRAGGLSTRYRGHSIQLTATMPHLQPHLLKEQGWVHSVS